MFVTSQQAVQLLGITPQTLRAWDKKKLIPTIRTPTNHRLYDVSQFKTQEEKVEAEVEKTKGNTFGYVIYARVSSKKQKEDLQRQVEHLKTEYPDHAVITDIASGVNFQRPGLQRLLQLSHKRLVKQIVVADRDRLCRFAFELLEFIFELNETRLLVHNQTDDNSDAESTGTSIGHTGRDDFKELAEDIIAINTFFACRLQGRRAARNRRNRKKAENTIQTENSEDEALLDDATENSDEEMDRDV